MLNRHARLTDFINSLALIKGHDHVMNDRELSELLGCERSYVSQLRKGRAKPSDEIFLKILQELNCSERDIDEAFAKLAAWRAAEKPEAQKVWMRIASRLTGATISVLVGVTLAPSFIAHPAQARELSVSGSVYYERIRRAVAAAFSFVFGTGLGASSHA